MNSETIIKGLEDLVKYWEERCRYAENELEMLKMKIKDIYDDHVDSSDNPEDCGEWDE